MQKQLFVFLFMTSFTLAQSQADSAYREDQIYAAIGYPLLLNAPDGITQNKLSHNFSLGYIRDMPINDNRNIAIGLGLGINYNVLFTNLQFNDDMTTNVVSSDIINQWNSTEVEIPLEFRWRNSTPTNYRFWRVYAGLVGHYALSAKQYTNSGSLKSSVPLTPRNFRLAFRLNVGNNTWNLTYSYPIDSLFDFGKSAEDKTLNEIKTAKLGLIFYIF
ncbi:MAG: outer membrane beta-barrel protein [Flavobacteriaceae bacterium]